ncbi:unnamed protein product, partial [Nesidiocoris tenuis]
MEKTSVFQPIMYIGRLGFYREQTISLSGGRDEGRYRFFDTIGKTIDRFGC